MITTTMTSAPPVATAMAAQPDAEGGAAGGAKPVLIRLEQLTKVYTEGEREHIVLDELNREFYRGEFVCLLGKSGSGKSTLLNLLSGIDAPTRGHVVIASGNPASSLSFVPFCTNRRAGSVG